MKTKLTKAERYAYDILMEEGDIPDTGLIVHGIRRKTMQQLWEKGLVKFMPYGNPPRWKGLKEQ